MKQTVYLGDFHDAFRAMDRLKNFSIEGRDALFAYLEDYEDSTGETLELDVIALCCDFTKYENLDEYRRNYTRRDYETLEDVEYETTVIRIP